MQKEIKGGYIKSETHNNITTIEFSHPRGNSMPGKLLEELANTIHGAGNEDDTKVIILRSGGDRSFCAGAAFEELVSIKSREEGLEFFSGFAHVINAMRKCPKFIIARIQGKCVGGGVGIVSAADYAIAIDGADVKLSELSIGIGPFVVGPVVERRIGLSAFSHLAIDATMWRSADWAKRKGLFAELHPTVTDMDESISRLSNSLTHSNPEAMAEMKKIFWKGSEHWDQLLIERAAISGRLVLSSFTKNALAKIQ
jgi:methylglutaconyl-CoA hydratase